MNNIENHHEAKTYFAKITKDSSFSCH